MRLWQKLWLLFAAIWVVVAAIQVATILGFSEETEKAIQPVILGVAVPAVLYGICWLIWRWRRSPPGS